jgi:hypothetical protein
MMRKALAAAVAAGLLALVGGCSPFIPTPTPRPSPFRPDAGTCHASYVSEGPASIYKPIDCEQRHVAETIYVGTLRDAVSRPVAGTIEAFQAFQAFTACDGQAGEFLGGDWHGAKLRLQLTIPSREDWAAGARWYRCELSPIDVPSHFSEGWHGSLRGELAKADSRLALHCLSFDPGDSGLLQIPCSDKHNSEYVGTIGITTLDEIDDSDRLAERCLDQVGIYAGITYHDELDRATRVWWNAPQDHEFLGGDHRVRCFAWWAGTTKTRSLKAPR